LDRDGRFLLKDDKLDVKWKGLPWRQVNVIARKLSETIGRGIQPVSAARKASKRVVTFLVRLGVLLRLSVLVNELQRSVWDS
jgi:hypothetical protein